MKRSALLAIIVKHTGILSWYKVDHSHVIAASGIVARRTETRERGVRVADIARI